MESNISVINKLDHLSGFINFPEKDFIQVMINRYYYSSPNGAHVDLEQRNKINSLYDEYTN